METQTKIDWQSPKPKLSKLQLDNKNHKTTGNKIPNIAKTSQNCSSNCGQSTYKPKICLLSSNKENKVLSIAQDVMPRNDFNFCHYLTPQADTIKLLTGLQSKLSGFTKKDYCIVFISDQDILEEYNYVKLVQRIRETIQEITHTTVILCTPTYHFGYGKDAINRKIYSFNDLMLHDVQTYKYAHLIDTNECLVYDYSMFHKPSGKINNTGLLTIFQKLTYLIKNISENVEPSDSYKIELSSNDNVNIQNHLFRV